MTFPRSSRRVAACVALVVLCFGSQHAAAQVMPTESISTRADCPRGSIHRGTVVASSAIGPSAIRNMASLAGAFAIRPNVSDSGSGAQNAASGSGSAPNLVKEFIGPEFDPVLPIIPPNTSAAEGLNHIVTSTADKLEVFDKFTGQKLLVIGTPALFNANVAVARIVFDPHHQRWCAVATDGRRWIYFAYSLSADPMGTWFTTQIDAKQGLDFNKQPNILTLGFDANGIYLGVQMVEITAWTMTIYAIDNAPLLSATPTMGTTTAFQLLPHEHALQPCWTYGSSGGEYFLTRSSLTTLRLRQVTGPLTSPSLVEVGMVNIPSQPILIPDAPQLGTAVKIDTFDFQPANAVFRNGSIWNANAFALTGRAAIAWYEIDPLTVATRQVGTISDPSLCYYTPSIAVNANNEVAIGFSGSDAAHYVGAYFSGRIPSDPPNQAAAPVLYKAGEAPFDQATGGGMGVAYFGFWSATTVDPVDDATFWTVQQYAAISDVWTTRIAELKHGCIPSTNYCAAKPTSHSCLPHLADNGAPPSMSSPAGFMLTASQMEAHKSALLFFSVTGESSQPFQGGLLCVSPPLYRLAVQHAGGSTACSGSVSYTLAGILAQSHGGGSIGVGTQVYCQMWGRDPLDPFRTSLSDGLRFFVCQ